MHSHLQLAAIRAELEHRVTERTAALEESKETFQRLSELLQVGVHRSNRAGEIIWANRKWFAVLGLEDGNWDGEVSIASRSSKNLTPSSYRLGGTHPS